MPTWEVELIPEAQADFKKLEASVKKRVLKQLVKLEQNPRYGDPLGNKSTNVLISHTHRTGERDNNFIM